MTYVDPFAGGTKTPALSFKNAVPGTAYTVVVSKLPELVQSRDFKTGEPAFWPDGNKKMAAVVTGTLPDGTEVSVWAPQPSSMFAAIAQAQKDAGAQIAPGGRLTVQLTGFKPSDDPKKEPQKLYAATYQPPDAFAQPAQQQAPVQQYAQPAPQQQYQQPVQQPVYQQPMQQPVYAQQPTQQGMTTDPALLAQQLGAMAQQPQQPPF